MSIEENKMGCEAQSQGFFGQDDAEKRIVARQIMEFKKNIETAEASLKMAIESMKKNFESLYEMQNEHNALEVKYGEKPPREVQKQLLKLEVNIEYIQSAVKETKPQERIQKMEDTIAAKNIELRRLMAQAVLNDVDLNDLNENNNPIPSR